MSGVNSSRALLVFGLALALGTAGCGDDGNGDEDTATDVPADNLDTTSDSATDTLADVPADDGAVTCFLPQIECGGACIDPRVDPAYCGDCDTVCASPQVCSQSACEDACATDLTDCDRACVSLETSNDNCGECGLECESGMQCGHLVCTSELCHAGQVYCFGHCTELSSSMFNCGECGNACDMDTEQCQEGVCMPSS